MLNTNGLIKEYIKGDWWEINENANTMFSYQDLRRKISSEGFKKFWLEEVYTPEIRKMYSDGLAHIHDLSDYCVYCVGWSLEDILRDGFIGVRGEQTSSPPKHLSTFLGQITTSFFTTQNEAAGAQAFSSLDTYAAPFIRYKGRGFDEVLQDIQKFKFEINARFRHGGQSPFTNVTLDQRILPHFEDKSVIYAGKETGDVYGDFADEIKMFNDAWWTLSAIGDAAGRPQPFPIETLNVTKDFDWDDEILFRAVALRGAPYFANFIGNKDMKPEDSFSMCCRYTVDLRKLIRKNGGYFGSGVKTGSIGVVTMNLPLMGYLSNNEDEFFNLLKSTMITAKESLELKRVELERLMNKNFYPYSKIYLQPTHDRWNEWWRNHFSTIGLLGMNEAILNLFGHGIETREGLKFAVKVINFMRTVLIQFQEETGNSYNLEETPAESTVYRTALRDITNYPDIVTAGTKNAPYYTNGSKLPVGYKAPLGFYLKHQNHLLPKYTGGSVFHMWNGETVPPWESISKIINKMCSNYEITYMTYSPTSSICPVHNFIPGEYHTCPKCGEPTEVWNRITGYFAEVSRWNIGKKQEFKERIHFSDFTL